MQAIDKKRSKFAEQKLWWERKDDGDMSHVNTPKCHSSQHFIAVFFKGIHLKMSIHASRLEALHGEIHSNTQPYNYFSHSNLFHLTHL